MEFRNHSSQELAQHHFTDHNFGDNTSIPRNLFPKQLGQSSPDSARIPPQTVVGPTWLNSAILQQHQSQYGDVSNNNNFLNLQRNSSSQRAPNQWLSRLNSLHRNAGDVNGSLIDAVISNESADLRNTDKDFKNMGRNQVENNGGGGGELIDGDVVGGIMIWQNARYKAEVLAHPLYDQLLSAHVACLRIATPVDQLLRIDAKLAQSQQVVAKYSALSRGNDGGDKELDQFMTHYALLICSFKEQLQQHVCVHAMEAVMACWEIEQSLQSLTGISAGEGTGATMSDNDDNDDDDQVADANVFDGCSEGPVTMGFGPLALTESEKSLMERIREELKHELKLGYKEKILDIREEILRKRRAGKLPGDTTSVLKAWWQSHAKWPYPTEEDKANLIQETGCN